MAVVNLLHLPALARSVAAAALVLFACFVFLYLLERQLGADTRRYRSVHFWHDVAYAMFYRGGIYQALIGAAVANALPPLTFMQLGVFRQWPLPAAALAFWIVSDFLGYWVHRLQHRVRFLWAFHSVHHAQEQLTFLTSYRIHPIEQLSTSVILFVPLLVIGLPTTTWLPLVTVLTALEFAQHSYLPWRFGRLYTIVVSPVFHAVHHSRDPQEHHRNFGKILSAWDLIFGTLARRADRPLRFGLKDPLIDESLVAQMLTPFRLVIRQPESPAPRGKSVGAE